MIQFALRVTKCTTNLQRLIVFTSVENVQDLVEGDDDVSR